MMKIEPLIGKMYNDIVILDILRQDCHRTKALCKCVCGNTFTCLLASLKSGNTKSCGCRKLRVNKSAYKLFDTHAEILIKDKSVIIDKEDLPLVGQFNWYLSTKGYPLTATTVKYAKQGRIMSIARLLLNFPDGYVDHINRNRLDNRKGNLRVLTNRANCVNSTGRKNSTSKYKGVAASGKRWKVMVGKLSIGTFDTEIEAALAYDVQAKLLYGDTAYLNFLGGTNELSSTDSI